MTETIKNTSEIEKRPDYDGRVEILDRAEAGSKAEEARVEDEARQQRAEQLDMAEQLDKLIAEANPDNANETLNESATVEYSGVFFKLSEIEDKNAFVPRPNDGTADTIQDVKTEQARPNKALPKGWGVLVQGAQSLPGVAYFFRRRYENAA